MSTATTPSTRERLLSAARELVELDGYGGASVLAISERAGVAAGTLYRHFASKEELFVELFRLVCDRELKAMERAASVSAGPVAGVEQVLLTFAQRALSSRRLAWALLAEPVDPLVDAERLVYRRRYAALVARLLEQAVAAGEIAAQDTAFTAAALVGSCGEVLVGPLSPASPAEPDAVLAALSTFIRRAVGARA